MKIDILDNITGFGKKDWTTSWVLLWFVCGFIALFTGFWIGFILSSQSSAWSVW